MLGYPIYKLVTLSFEQYGLFELIQHKGHWIGLDNYGSVLHDHVFWDTVVRTVVFTIVNVGLTIVLGTLIALLLPRISAGCAILLMSGLVLVWAMPVVVAVQVFYWMTNFENGVLNYLLAQLHLGRRQPRLVRDAHLEPRDGDAADRLGRAALRRRSRVYAGARAGARRARRGGARSTAPARCGSSGTSPSRC